jgi:hypothetical protein
VPEESDTFAFSCWKVRHCRRMTFKNHRIPPRPRGRRPTDLPGRSTARGLITPGKRGRGCPCDAFHTRDHPNSSGIFNNFNYSTPVAESAKVSDTIATLAQIPGQSSHETHLCRPPGSLDSLATHEPPPPAPLQRHTDWRPRRPRATTPPRRGHFACTPQCAVEILPAANRPSTVTS